MNVFSIQFWALVPLIVLYYFLPDGKPVWRKVFLIAVSLALYASWSPWAVLFLLFVGAVTYGGGLLLEKAPSEKRRAIAFWGFLALAVLPLITLKAMPAIDKAASLFFPIGLSFYSLQAAGYLSDVYHRRIPAVKNALDYSLFISFFPQLSSGPISKAGELVPQLADPKRPDAEDYATGLKCLVWGVFLKSVVADCLGLAVNAIYGNYLYYTGADCLLAAFLYCFQLYADFFGYTLIALGLAHCCGIRLIDNFKQPFLSVSIGEFWRRWHISLSRWLKDYIYIPLGGSRCSGFRTACNLLITFFISGLWHGVSWTFVCWGVFLGLGCTFERIFKLNRTGEGMRWFLRIPRQAITFCVITFSFIIFRCPSLEFFRDFMSHIIFSFGSLSLPDIGRGTILTWIIGISILVAKDLYAEYIAPKRPFSPWVSAVTAALLICLILSFGVLSGGNFIYVNF